MRIIRRLRANLSHWKASNLGLQSVLLCGKPLKLIPGTLRAKEDQDDAWWFYLAKYHDTIFDIGCNIGYTALLALIENPNKYLLLVDPNPLALQKAATNLIVNGMGSHVHYLSSFVSNSVKETVTFYTVGSGAAGSMHASHAKTAALTNSCMEVQTVSLDYLFDLYKVFPDLVKIDVEGAEALVIEGAKEMAKATACNFFVELHTVEGIGMEGMGQYMLDWCEEMEYKAWYLKTGSVLTNAQIIKSRGKCHLLLMPKHRAYPKYLIGVSQNAKLPKL